MAVKSPLPIIDGVSPSRHWLPRGPWKTVLAFLTERFPFVSAETWLDRMASGEILSETGSRLHADSPYREGACIFYYRRPEIESRIPFEETVIYEDENILIVDKPHFLPVIPAGRFLHESLLVRLRKQGKPETLAPVHRLDRETAGIIMFSVNPGTIGRYTKLFRDRKVRKVYEALAPKNDALSFPLIRRSRIERGEPFFRMREVEGEPNTETQIETDLSSNDAPQLYKLCPATGKKHQLRVHMAALGIPIVNDRLYPGYSKSTANDDDFSQPLKLIARSIAFTDPITGVALFFRSEREL